MSKSLVQITSEVNQLAVMLLESQGLITPEIENALAVKEIALPEKVDNYSYILDRIESEIEFYKKRAEMFDQAASTLNNAKKRLKDRLEYAMNEMGVTELVGNEIKFKRMNSKSKLVIDDEEMIDVKYKSEKTVTVIDKDALYEDLKRDSKVVGAHLEPVSYIRAYVNKGSVK